LNQDKRHPYGMQHHTVQLTGLQPATTYFFRVERANGEGLRQGRFRTEAPGFAQNTSVRITNGPMVEEIRPDSITLAWSTNARSSTVVRYGTDPNVLTQTAEAQWGQTDHRVVIRNLRPATNYFFQVESSQAQG